MTLDQAMNIALTGLRASQQNLNVISNNIANANTEGYARRIAIQTSEVQGGISQGVNVGDVRRNVDALLVSQITKQLGNVGFANHTDAYYTRIQDILGKPSADNSLNVFIDSFFNSLRTLSTNTELPSVRLDTVTQGDLLADQISTTARKLEELRLSADKELRSTFSSINNDINRIYNLNNAIKDAYTNGSNAPLDLVEQRQQIITALAEKINIDVFEQSDGRVNISTSSGVTLLDTFRREIDYPGVGSAESFVNGSTLSAAMVYSVREDGTRVGQPEVLVSSGVSSDITNAAKGGKVRALTDMRDIEIPRILAQLDNLAASFRDAFNAIHNDGTGLPSRNDVIGTREVFANEQHDFTGEVRIALLDETGRPIPSPYDGESGYRPLTLDLGAIESGYGAGSPTVQDIIDEINYYYGPPQPRATLGPLTDIKLAMKSDNISTGNTVSFDLELDNASAKDAIVTIQGVTVTDSNAVGAAATFSNTPFTIEAGDRTRTGSDFNVSFTDTGGAPDVPYTITVNVLVQNGNESYNDTLTFTIGNGVPATGPGLRNQRVAASAISGTGNAEIIPSPGGQRLAYAEIVDADGNTITDPNEPGFLRIRATNSDYGVAMDEMDSKEVGSSTDRAIVATNRGFSHFFELNDFFVRNDTLKNSAINLHVREDILDNPNLISMGDLTLSAQPFDDDTAIYTYEVGNSSNQTVSRLANLRGASIAFASAGTLPATSGTLSDYTGDIIALSSTKALRASDNLTQQNLFRDSYQERFQAGSGVNIDEELANTILFQNTYSASSRIINIVKELFDDLLALVG
jgi:flagellar hook-associated protein 1 FlgK